MKKNIKVLKFGGSMYVILVYDIMKDNSGEKVAQKIYKICKKYLVHIQASVFEGELTNAQMFALENELKRYI